VVRESDRIETLRPARLAEERAPEVVGTPETDLRFVEHEPRGVGEILDLGFEILRGRFATVLGLCALLWLPVRLLQPVVASVQSANPDPFALLAFAAWGAGSAVVQALATAVVALVVFAVLRGEPIGISRALRLALASVWGVIVISLATGVATAIGMLFCLAPGVYLSFKLALWPSAYVIERGTVGRSLSRSLLLSTGSFPRWAGVIGVLIAVSVPLGGVTIVFDNPEASAAVVERLGIPPAVFGAIGVAVTSLFSGLATSITALGLTVLYLDCRVRRDGLDLARRLELLRASSARAAPEPAA
jgi:hypothetical protein